MPINANVSGGSQITASVGETQIDVSVSGGFGPTGPTGPAGPAGAAYTLPVATASVLGGVKIGSGISIDGNGVISASSGYTLPTATNGVLGGVKIGSGVTITDGVISVSTAYAATSHSHGSITSGGAIGTTANLPIITTTGGVLATGSFGSSANTFCSGNDSRLSDSRNPTAHTHGNITNDGKIGTASGQIVVTTTGGALTTAATISSSQVSGLGTLATQSGTFSGASSGTNTGDQTIALTGDVTGSGTGSFAATLSNTGVSAGTFTSVTVDAKGRVTAGSSPAVAYSSLSGTPSTFAPSSHKASHATGGSDALTASDIGAAASSHTHAASDIASGTIATARLGSGAASSGNFLRGDGTWAAAGSTSASDLSSGTLADARLTARARAAVNVFNWSSFR